MNEEIQNRVNEIISKTPAPDSVTITFNNGDSSVVGKIEQSFQGEITISVVDEYGRDRFYDFKGDIIEDIIES